MPFSIILTILFMKTLKFASNEELFDYKHCRERNRLVETEKGDLYALIDAVVGQKITLQCHFCNENDDGHPKIWYKIDHYGGTEPHEVYLDMNNDPSKNKIEVNKEHSLIINNLTANDSGMYYCTRFEGENQQEKHNFLVDLVYPENSSNFESGNFTDWRKYHDEYFTPINMLFKESEGKDYKFIRNYLNIDMEMITEWNPWGICEVCGRLKGEGVRKKIGFCRIKLNHRGAKANGSNFDQYFFLRANAVACRAQILGRIFPDLSNLTKVIPNFVQIQACEGTCNPDALGSGRGWKSTKKFGFKYRKSYTLHEGAHLTIICPESSMENVIIWKKNGKNLPTGESVQPSNPEDEPRITVDTFNTLYLLGVKESEEGNYTCFVDNVRMEQVMVYVISKSKIISKAFVRHMIYLSFVLFLTLPCYLAGVVIACSRRRFFKDYQQLREDATSSTSEESDLA